MQADWKQFGAADGAAIVTSSGSRAARPGNDTFFAEHVSAGQLHGPVSPIVVGPAYAAYWMLL